MKHCVGELWEKLKSQKKNALALGSLGEQLADDGNKAKRCLSRPQDPESRTNCVNLLAVPPSASDSSLVTQIHQALFWGW